MKYCPNCGKVAQKQHEWEGVNGIRINVEYICQCGCHWVNRYDFFRRDIISQGTNTDRTTPIKEND